MTAPLSRAVAILVFPLALLALSSIRADGPTTKASAKIDFNRDIRPILSDNCFACHGPDAKKRKGGLRLDSREAVLKLGSLIPGKSAESEVYTRLIASEPRKLMPPAKSGKKLTPDQVALIQKWIDQGGSYAEHWAYVPPTRPALPAVKNTAWPKNGIDHFVLARLEQAGLTPAPEANKIALIRRVTFDLTGLPPTLAEVDAFLADTSANAYEKVIDRLLKSPRYGEHMGRYWLDLARFGDTHGLHLDNYREMWPFRDWVVKAFNSNLTYDKFITKQLAGDLLPDSKLDDLVATGFNRAHVTTSEGGSITEEVHIRNVIDRVETTGTVMLGLTIGCARCHDHKFDPILMKDFYSLSAFFNNLEGNPLDGNAARHPPTIKVPTPEQETALADLDKNLASARKALSDRAATLVYDDKLDAKETEKPKRADFVWIDDALPGGTSAIVGGQNKAWTFVGKPEPVHQSERSVKLTTEALGQNVLEKASAPLKVGAGDKLFAWVYLDPKSPPKQIMLQWHTSAWSHRAYWGENLIPWGKDNSPERRSFGPLPATGKWVRLEVPIGRVGLKPGMNITGWAFTQHGGTAYWDAAGITTEMPQQGGTYDTLTAWIRVQKALRGAGLPAPIQAILKIEREKRTPAQQKQLRDHFVQNVWAKGQKELSPLRAEVTRLEGERKKFDEAIPVTYIFREKATPTQAYILKRGEYDQRGEKVDRALPAFLPNLPAGAPMNRLGVAQWLLSRNNPLPSRVAVNRYWQQLFGVGLVKTSEDFGVQGEPPSHPELLDWLAVEFMESGWDVKRMMKLIVLSSTYRQSAKSSPEKLAKDPANRLLARGPRFRLDAEMIRDQALAVSGLLVEKLGGPSVKPPQPLGLWSAVAYVGSNTNRFTADTGPEKVHRRSLYTFWKRTSPPPQMSTFDAPSREACTARRERTNTPLQALLLLNDPQYVEFSRALAERALAEGGNTEAEQLTYLFRLATCRKPDTKELGELTAALKDLLAMYQGDAEAAKKLIAIGETKPAAKIKPEILAAWTMIASTVLNLDEVLNKG